MELTTSPTSPNETFTCISCSFSQPLSNYPRTRSPFFPNHHSTLCNDCLNSYLSSNSYSWSSISKLCQFLDIPFIVKEWDRLYELHGTSTFPIYASIFESEAYEGFDWSYYNSQYLELKKASLVEDEIPVVRDAHFQKLRETWGSNYDEESLLYLEELYRGLLTTQNVSGALQIDQARKLCKISYSIESAIRHNEPIDKLLASYEKLVKIGEFTPKNTKNATDFDSFSEAAAWLEKRGWVNDYYDGVTRDVLDETIKNFQTFNQRLYTNETSIGQEITNRINALRSINPDALYEEPSIYQLEQLSSSDPNNLDSYSIEPFEPNL